ncbi:MAG: DUF4258 domain-containing protein [archaeon]
MGIFFSNHAREQMIDRGISIDEVKEAIKRGEKSLQTPDKLLFHYKYYCVVSKKIGDNYFIITVKPR